MEENEKQNYIGSLAFFTSCFIICIIILLIHCFIPDILDVKYITENLTPPLEVFVAENAEKVSYIVSVLSFPVIFWLTYIFFKRHIDNFSEKKLKIIIITELISGVVSFPLFTIFSDVTRHLYYIKLLSPILPVATFFIFMFAYFQYNKKPKYTLWISIFIYAIIIFYIYQIFLVFDTPTYATSKMDLHHFEVYFAPIYKTISGMTPGIDFRNLYGFYPYIYSLFFNINNVSIQGISLFNAILVALIFGFLTFVLFSNIKNKVLAFLIYNVCVVYSLFACFNVQISRHGIYYLQYQPHRVFFPMLICALITLYLKINNEKIKKITEYLGYILCSAAIFWNMESGIAALAGWGALHFYLSINKEHKFKLISLVIIKSVFSLLIAFALITVITYIHSSQLINPIGMFFGQFVFYAKGFYMKKMNIINEPFILVVLPYLIAIADSVKSVIENKIEKIDTIKFTFAVIGFGLFTYFQGRSHVMCLMECSWPSFIIIGILMESYYNKFKKYQETEDKNNLSEFISKVSLIKFILLFTVSSVITTGCMIYMCYMPVNIKTIRETVYPNSVQIKNLKLLKSSEQYDFLTQDASFYYMHFKQPNLLPFPSMEDCFFQKDYIDIDNYLQKSDKKLVIDNETLKNISIDYFNNYYVLENSNDIIYIYKKK